MAYSYFADRDYSKAALGFSSRENNKKAIVGFSLDKIEEKVQSARGTSLLLSDTVDTLRQHRHDHDEVKFHIRKRDLQKLSDDLQRAASDLCELVKSFIDETSINVERRKK